MIWNNAHSRTDKQGVINLVGLARTIYIYGVHTVFVAGKSPNIRSYAVRMYTILANPKYWQASASNHTPVGAEHQLCWLCKPTGWKVSASNYKHLQAYNSAYHTPVGAEHQLCCFCKLTGWKVGADLADLATCDEVLYVMNLSHTTSTLRARRMWKNGIRKMPYCIHITRSFMPWTDAI